MGRTTDKEICSSHKKAIVKGEEMIRFAGCLTDTEITNRLERLKASDNSKAKKECELLLAEQEQREKSPPKKIKKAKYPCDTCSAPINSTRCYNCPKIKRWSRTPTKLRDYTEPKEPKQ